jgi:MoaA/NifB/PqqE/SkfB family radical SAM enzyme
MKKSSYVVIKKIDKTALWKGRQPLLASLDIELTERCNNNCQHCYINLPQNCRDAKTKELSTKEIKDILKEAVSLGCMKVRFTGGEPLLREDFKELYIFARKLGLRVLIFTNATLIDLGLAELFVRIPSLEKIEVTVYGMKKASYEPATRKKGTFQAAWRGIGLLLKHKIPFVVKSAILPSNKNEIDEFEAWAATIPWMDKPPSHSMFFDLRCRRDDAKKNALIRSVRVSPDEGLEILKIRAKEYLKEMKEFCAKFIGPPGEKLFSCGSGCNGGCVDAYGTFQPCMMLRHPDVVYGLKNGTLNDAMVNFFPKIRKISAVNPDYLLRCARCFLKGLCEQCPGKSWMEYGTLDTPVEYCCKAAHVQAKYLGLLKENEKPWEVKDWKNRIRQFTRKEVFEA